MQTRKIPSVRSLGGRERKSLTLLDLLAIILPWNYPLIHTAQKISPALACRNTVVLKPSQWAALPVLRLGELLLKAGFPPAVVNIVTGTGTEIGAAITENVHRPEIVAKLSRSRLGAPVTPKMVAAVLSHPQGGKNTPSGTKVIPFLNKMDTVSLPP